MNIQPSSRSSIGSHGDSSISSRRHDTSLPSCRPPAGTACDALVNVPAHNGVQPGVATLTFTVRVADPLPSGVTAIANAVALDDGTPPDCTVTPNHPACVVVPTVNLRLTKTVAYVVLKPGQAAGDALKEDLRAFCKTRLAPHKTPREIHFAEELPKTATGKIQRFKLRALEG